MATKSALRVTGSIMDVARLQSLSGEDCNILFVSSRTLYMLANYASGEAFFLGRYAREFLDGGLVDVVEPGDAEEEFILEQANNFGLEVVPMCQELVDLMAQLVTQVGAINTNIQLGIGVEGCCTPYGTILPEAAPELGDPEVDDPPDGFDTWDDYLTYKCSAANQIADDWVGTLDNLQTLGGLIGAISAIALAAFLSTSLLGGLLVGLMAIGFSAASAGAIVIGVLIALIGGGVGLFAYFADLSSAMEADKDALVCDLFFAQSTVAAKNIVLQFTSDKALGLTYDPVDDEVLFQATVNTIADALFDEAVTNTLFELNPSVEGYVGDVDCDTCVGSLDWVLIPSGAYKGYVTAEGTLGTGIIDQDGAGFTLTSAEMTGGPFMGQHIVGMAVNAFVISQIGDSDMETTPGGSVGGQITLTSGPETTNNAARQVSNALDCFVSTPTIPSEAPPVVMTNQQLVVWRTASSNIVELTIDTPTDECEP